MIAVGRSPDPVSGHLPTYLPSLAASLAGVPPRLVENFAMKDSKLAQRRRFLKTALQAGAALAMPYLVPASVLGKNGAVPPSEQIVMGAIGIGGRGSYDIGCFMEQPDVRFVACSDVRADRRMGVKRRIEEFYGIANCPAYRDFRDLLARPEIDAVLITTGSNWHTMLSIHAAKAGKDMYCEKPCSKNIVESLAPGRHHSAARPACFRAGCSGGTCRTSSLPLNWPARASSANWKPSTRIPADWAQGAAAGCRRAGAGERRGRLGHVPGHGGLAALQLRNAQLGL